jgi:photosystem II stability/assembly factor-like uncharacterized protein
MLNDGVRLSDRSVAIVGLSGVVLISNDGAHTFELREQADRKGLSAVLPATPGALAIVGEGGTRVLSIAAASASSQ